MNKLHEHKQPVNPDQSFRVGIIFSKIGVVILSQGKLQLTYSQLIGMIASLALLITTGMPILSQFLPH